MCPEKPGAPRRVKFDIAEAVEHYEKDGASVRYLARRYGCSYGTMYRRLVEAKAKLRPRNT
jgi:transposase-like protein